MTKAIEASGGDPSRPLEVHVHMGPTPATATPPSRIWGLLRLIGAPAAIAAIIFGGMAIKQAGGPPKVGPEPTPTKLAPARNQDKKLEPTKQGEKLQPARPDLRNPNEGRPGFDPLLPKR